MKQTPIAAMAVAAMLLFGGKAQADIIYTGTTVGNTGTGFGSILNVLTLHNNGTEVGSVEWDGSGDVLTGDAANQSQTRSIQELIDAGMLSASEIGIIYNVNQQGNEGALNTQLNGFTFDIYASDGTLLGSWDYDGAACPTQCFPPAGQGTGSSGYLFTFDAAQAAEVQAFFADPTNRVGMSGDVSLSNDGAENFYLQDIAGTPPPPPVIPEPTTLLLLGSGLVGLASSARRRRRNAQA